MAFTSVPGGAPDGGGPGGIFLLDPFSFDVLGKWEMDRGSQYLGYDFWWRLTQDTLLTSEWGTPNQIENGVIPEELLQSAVPPLVTDINLSLDDRFLYISCWGTGEMLQYDVSDPFHPKKSGSVHIGGIVRQTPHPPGLDQPLRGALKWSR